MDDSDLFHLAKLSETDDDYFQRVQEAHLGWPDSSHMWPTEALVMLLVHAELATGKKAGEPITLICPPTNPQT